VSFSSRNQKTVRTGLSNIGYPVFRSFLVEGSIAGATVNRMYVCLLFHDPLAAINLSHRRREPTEFSSSL
jgi:hypothetical protein